MAITKPYTFQAGTKARAGEVNQDFDILYSEVNRIGTEILNIDVDIQDILASKADVNGNATQRFQMANPEASYDGVNKTFLESAISNIKEYISGFIITKDTENTIIVSPGSCYDSNLSTIIISSGNITKENTTQSPDTTYYVHVISDNTGRQVDILISTQLIEPPLPSSYTLYRNIGKFITDEEGNISDILYYGNEQATYNQISGMVKKYINGTSGYILYSDGLKIQWGRGAGSVTLLLPYSDANYCLVVSQLSGAIRTRNTQITGIRQDGFSVYSEDGWTWFTIGY
jgi:hypothetical protein